MSRLAPLQEVYVYKTVLESCGATVPWRPSVAAAGVRACVSDVGNGRGWVEVVGQRVGGWWEDMKAKLQDWICETVRT